jgi:hypothetical protein
MNSSCIHFIFTFLLSLRYRNPLEKFQTFLLLNNLKFLEGGADKNLVRVAGRGGGIKGGNFYGKDLSGL